MVYCLVDGLNNVYLSLQLTLGSPIFTGCLDSSLADSLLDSSLFSLISFTIKVLLRLSSLRHATLVQILYFYLMDLGHLWLCM